MSTGAAINSDGTVTCRVESQMTTLTHFGLLELSLPVKFTRERLAGRFFLARCSTEVFFRRPLFLAKYESPSHHDATSKASCTFIVPFQPFVTGYVPATRDESCGVPIDPGYRWLARLPSGAEVNLLGPFGNGFELHAQSRNVLLATTGHKMAHLLPLVNPVLDRGGRIALIVHTNSVWESQALQETLVPKLPIAAELLLIEDQVEWMTALSEVLLWADQLCAAIPDQEYSNLALRIKEARFRLETGFAQLLVEADLLCGVGACLACVVPTANGGYTRACVNGPVFDLTAIAHA